MLQVEAYQRQDFFSLGKLIEAHTTGSPLNETSLCYVLFGGNVSFGEAVLFHLVMFCLVHLQIHQHRASISQSFY